MSILIKDMKMPHSCMGCRFCEHGSINEWDLYCGIDNKHVGNWDDKHINNGWRHPDCPLVEVSTPHGRLIDGDILESLIYERLSDLDYKADTFDILRAVQEMSTIIGTEEKEK